MTSTLWQPLLQGSQALEAERAVDRIARGIPRLSDTSRSAPKPGLASGHAGQALFWAYLAQCRDDDSAVDAAITCLDRASDGLAEVTVEPGLYEGFAGVGWVMESLSKALFEASEDDPNSEIDQAVLRCLAQRPWRRDYDLVRGLVGLGVYLLKRLPRRSAVRGLEAVVDHLAVLAVEQDEGLRWLTPPTRLSPERRQLYPKGYYDLGVAHGVPAVIAVLAAICRAEVALTVARPLLEGAVRGLLSCRIDQDRCCYPALVCEGTPPRVSRFAWCYGDPGIAATLLSAARCVGRADWRAEALSIARVAAQRSIEGSEVGDATLCHGSAGLGHLFNRIHQATGDPRCGEAARFWFGHTLDLARADAGFTGFLSLAPSADGGVEQREEPGFLIGVAGIGLALLAATSAVAPDWDQVMLLAIPPHSDEEYESIVAKA